MRMPVPLVTLATLLAVTASPAVSQVTNTLPVEIELGGGVGFPLGDFAESGAVDPGTGISGLLRLNVARDAALYAGGTWWRFGLDEEEVVGITDATYTDLGGSFGVEVNGNVPPRLQPFLGGGVTLDRLSLDAQVLGEDLEIDSEWSAGLEGRIGVRVGVVPGVALAPLLRFRSFKPRWSDQQADDEEGRISYLTLELALTVGR